MFINALLNGVIQVIIFALIPFVWWLITARKKQSFFAYLGLKKFHVNDAKKYVLVLCGIVVFSFVLGQIAIALRGDMEAADSAYKGMGWIAVPSILVYSVIQTALSEEILFRGFLLKRLKGVCGFWIANLLQASIFGVIHLFMVWGKTTLLAGIVIVVYPIVIALLLGYLDEKLSDGSILPSTLVHGVLNTVENVLQALM